MDNDSRQPRPESDEVSDFTDNRFSDSGSLSIPPDDGPADSSVDDSIVIEQVAMDPHLFARIGVIFESALVVLALAIAWFFNFYDLQNPLSQLFVGATWIGYMAIGTLLSVPMLMIVQWMSSWNIASLKDFFKLVSEKVAPLFRSLSWFQVALISLSAGVGEELLFRWCLQGGLAQHLPMWVAIAIASLIFGAAHWLNAVYFVMASVIGIVMGLLYFQFGLLAAMACHAMYDFLAIRMLQREDAESLLDLNEDPWHQQLLS